MSFGNPSGNRQPETGPFRRPDPHESLEDAFLIRGDYPGAVVGDSKRHPIGNALELGGHSAVRSTVANGIVEQIPHHAAEQCGITGQSDLLGAARFHGDTALHRQQTGRPNALGQEIVEIDELRPQGNAVRLGARDEKHGVHQS